MMLIQSTGERIAKALNAMPPDVRKAALEAVRQEFSDAYWFETHGRVSFEVMECWRDR